MSGTLKDYKIRKDIVLFERTKESPLEKAKVNKTKAGRPKLKVKRQRKTVALYLYDDEYEKIKKIAKLESISSFIRGVLKDKFNI